MGRPAYSDEERELRGGRPSQIKALPESRHAGGKPRRPKDLCPSAHAEWNRLVRELTKRGTLTNVDSSGLEIYCRAFAVFKAACADIDNRGIMVEEIVLNRDGEAITRMVKNPCVQIAASQEHILARYLASFSATPITREKASKVKQPPKRNALVEGSREWLEQAIAKEESETPDEAVQETTTETGEQNDESIWADI